MKKVLIAAAAATVFFASCKKDNNTTTPTTTNNTWKVGSTTYTAAGVTVNGPSMVATNASGGGMVSNNLEFVFTGNNLPTANGTYNIVTSSSNDGEVSVDFTTLNLQTLTATTYSARTASGKTCTVTVNSGKVTVEVPQIYVINDDNTSDSTTLSAKILQP